MTSHLHVALSDVCQIVQGGRHKLSGSDFVAEGFPAYGAGGMNGRLPTYEFDRAAVVLSSIGARCGKCFLAEGRWSSLANTQVILPDTARADPRFLWYQLNDETRWPRSGTAQPFIKPSDVKAHRVFLPPLGEQRRIAAILDQADALRAKRRAALAQLDEMARAIFVEMFGRPGEQSPWPLGRLGDLCDLVRGSSPRPQGDPRFFGGPVPRLMIADITRDGMLVEPTIDSLTLEGAKRSRPMQAGSVVMAVSGAVGLPAILRVDACIHDGFVGFRALKPTIQPLFLYHCLKQQREQNRAQGTGAIWINLTTEQVSRFPIPLPPAALQQRFLERMQLVGELEDTHRRATAGLDVLFTSLQHRAFRGEL